MNNQKQKIAEFLDGITDNSLPLEQQIMLFSEEDGIEGAAADNGQCTNNQATCSGSSNAACKNYNQYCKDSKNTVCEGFNTSIPSCGGEGGDT